MSTLDQPVVIVKTYDFTLWLLPKVEKFSRAYRFHSTGLFRFWVAFDGDPHNAPGQSPALYVRATPAATSGGGVSPDVTG